LIINYRNFFVRSKSFQKGVTFSLPPPSYEIEKQILQGAGSPQKRRKKMSEEQKISEKGFPRCCAGMPLGDMMRKMMEAKKSGAPFNCAEMISQMKAMCCGASGKKERPTQETKEDAAPKQ
jgi:hypothetical protein